MKLQEEGIFPRVDNLTLDVVSPLARDIVKRGLISNGTRILSLAAGRGGDEALFSTLGASVIFTNDVGNPFPFKDSSFKIVYTRSILHHFNNSTQKGILREVFRVLEPGGLLILQLKSKKDILYSSQKMAVGDGMFYFMAGDFNRNYLSMDELENRVRNSGLQILEIREHNEILYAETSESTLITSISVKPKAETTAIAFKREHLKTRQFLQSP